MLSAITFVECVVATEPLSSNHRDESNFIMLHPRIKEVTERVIERSKATRQAYLARIQQAKKQTRVRSGLGCGNIAHVGRGQGPCL